MLKLFLKSSIILVSVALLSLSSSTAQKIDSLGNSIPTIVSKNYISMNELALGIGYSNQVDDPSRLNFLIGLRVGYFGGSFSAFGGDPSNGNPENDYECPHDDYSLEQYKKTGLAFTLEFYAPVTKNILVFPSFGIANHGGYGFIARSNATGWTYKSSNSIAGSWFAVYGAGVHLRISENIGLGFSYRRLVGYNLSLNIVLN